MIFDLINNEPRVTIEGIHIPEFRAIWEADDSEDKIRASQTLSYIYHIIDFKSVYSKLPENERISQVKEDFSISEFSEKEQALVDAAINKYKKLTETPALRLLTAARFAVDKFIEYFYSIDFEERDMQGKPIFSARELSSNLEKIGKIIQSLEELQKVVEKEQSSATQIKRGAQPSMIL